MTHSRLRLVAAAALVTAAATLAAPAPAGAATCGPGSGVTVVVDYHQLGGGVVTRCDASGNGKSAQSLFADNGFALAYVQRQPGFVCRVNNKPSADREACVNTPPSNAYWGLFWADGKKASWKYSTLGVGGLTLHDGQSVAFSWQASTSSTPPGVKPPTTSTPSPTPTPSSSAKATPKPSASSTPRASSSAPVAGTSVAPTDSPTPTEAARSATPGPTRSASASESPPGADSPSAADSTTAAAVTTASPPASGAGGDSDGLPAWALPAVLVALLATGGTTAYLRRRVAAGGGSRP